MAHLGISSRILYRIEHYGALPTVALIIAAVTLCLVTTVALLDFPSRWVAAFEVSVSAVTLMMVFVIQHTQGREQAATQRKLDELIRALPGADESLMMLEEASPEVMLGVEDRDAVSLGSVLCLWWDRGGGVTVGGRREDGLGYVVANTRQDRGEDIERQREDHEQEAKP
jgi:low affinity Fe/Cu permease